MPQGIALPGSAAAGHESAMKIIEGIAVAPGIEIARAFVLEQFRQRVPHHVVEFEEREGEVARFEQALAAALDDLASDRDRAARDLGPEAAKIFEFHLGLLHDPTLLDPMRKRIAEEARKNAPRKR